MFNDDQISFLSRHRKFRKPVHVFFFPIFPRIFFSRISTKKKHKKWEINEIVMYRTEDLKTSPFRF